MQIRPAELADAEAIAVVQVRSWQAAYQGLMPQYYLDSLTPAQRRPLWDRLLRETSWPVRGTLVAEVGEAVAGFVIVGPTRDEDDDPAVVAEIYAIYLLPAVWGDGIGRRLLTAACEVLAEAGYRQAALWVLDTNTRARGFYEANGLRVDGAVKYDDMSLGFPLTEVRYRRLLDRPGDGPLVKRPSRLGHGGMRPM